MSNYILLPDGRTVRDDELYHWKYVKREKQANGKYKYYYDWDELKGDVKTAVNDPLGNKRKAKLDEAKTQHQNAVNAISGQKMSNYHYAEAAKGRGTDYVSNKDKDDRATAVERYAQDKKRLDTRKAELDKAQKEYDKSLRAKIEKTPDTLRGLAEGAKQMVEDALGYDERNYRDYAKEVYEKMDDEYDNVREEKRKQEFDFSTDEGFDEVLKWNDKVNEALKKKSEWGQEYTRAQKEFMKTPLGMYEEAAEWLEIAAWDVENAVKKTAGKVADIADDVAFEVEYGVKKGLGIYQKREYEYVKKTLDQYTKEVDRLTKKKKENPHRFNNKDESDLFFAELRQEEYSRELKKAKSAYSGTPLHTIESGAEWVANLFKKKR